VPADPTPDGLPLPLLPPVGPTGGLSSLSSSGAPGIPSALLPLFAALVFVTWRAIERFSLRIPDGSFLAVLVPPG
jgi:hypothetical protein